MAIAGSRLSELFTGLKVSWIERLGCQLSCLNVELQSPNFFRDCDEEALSFRSSRGDFLSLVHNASLSY